MAPAGPRADTVPANTGMNMGTLRDVLLVRIACAGSVGVTRATLRSDIEPFVEHRLSPPDWRRSLDELVFILLTEGLVVTHRMRLATTAPGRAAATQFLGVPIPEPADWVQVRDVLLVGRALGVEVAQAVRRRKLESAQGLRGAILERSFGLPPARITSVAGLRNTLARKASVQGARGGSGKSAKENQLRSRRAVERLLRRPREFASDAALLAELAAEQVGAQQTSVPSLRKALLRKLVGRSSGERTPAMARAPGNGRGLEAAHKPQPVPVFDPIAFSQTVVAAARRCAEGWAGNRRAYIAAVWQQIAATHPQLGLTSETFKARLVEAHKAGHLTLAYADLRDRETMELVLASAVRDRNNEWHFVRVDD